LRCLKDPGPSPRLRLTQTRGGKKNMWGGTSLICGLDGAHEGVDIQNNRKVGEDRTKKGIDKGEKECSAKVQASSATLSVWRGEVEKSQSEVE